MERSPISILQESVVKSGKLPMYTEVSSKVGVETEFAIQVTWDVHTARGVARTKKEAKKNAAEEMIKLLSSMNLLKITPEITPTKTPVTLNTPLEKPSSSLINTCTKEKSNDPSEPFVNYVGLLQEYCATRTSASPMYDLIQISGASHLPQFTVSCKIFSICKEATASTKKAAKQDAARLALQHLEENANKELLKTAMDTSSVIETTKIMNTYKKMKDKPELVKSKALKYKDYSLIVNTCKDVTEEQLSNLLEYMNKEDIDPEYMKKAISNTFKVDINTYSLSTFKRGVYLICLKLDTDPVIAHFGLGVSIKAAETQAIRRALDSIFLLLT